jgi:hypothetical protein
MHQWSLKDMSDEYISPIGHTWDEVQQELFTPEEIAISKKRAARAIKRIEAREAREARKQAAATAEHAPLEP